MTEEALPTGAVLLTPTEEWYDRLVGAGPFGARPPTAIPPFVPKLRDVEPGFGIHETQEWTCPRCYGSAPPWHATEAVVREITHMRGCRLWSLVLGGAGVAVYEGMERAAWMLASREGFEPAVLPWSRHVREEFARDDEGFVEQPPRVVAVDTVCWALGGYPLGLLFWLDAAQGGKPEFTIPTLAAPPADLPPALLAPWALAVVCEARGMGRAVFIRAMEAG